MLAYLTIRWIGAKRTSELLMVGFIWLVLAVAFEGCSVDWSLGCLGSGLLLITT